MCRLRRRAEPGEFLVVGHDIAFADEEIGDLGAFLVGADDGLAARHDKSGDAHLVGETGIGGFGDNHLGLALRFLLGRFGPVLPPIVAARDRGKKHRSDRPLDVFGKRHGRINPGKMGMESKERRPWRGSRRARRRP